MKLYLISQSENSDYDTYSDAVVCVENEEEARKMHPSGTKFPWSRSRMRTWCSSPKNVQVTYLGEADPLVEYGVVCASFDAG